MKSKSHRPRRLRRWILLTLGAGVTAFVSATFVMPRIPQWWSCYGPPVSSPEARALRETPQPLPVVITGVTTEANCRTSSIGFAINTYELWEPSPKSESEVVAQTITFRIDGQPVEFGMNQTLFALNRYDELGNVVDHHGGDINVYAGSYYGMLPPPPVRRGLHIATVNFESVTGTEYTHQWAFEVTR